MSKCCALEILKDEWCTKILTSQRNGLKMSSMPLVSFSASSQQKVRRNGVCRKFGVGFWRSPTMQGRCKKKQFPQFTPTTWVTNDKNDKLSATKGKWFHVHLSFDLKHLWATCFVSTWHLNGDTFLKGVWRISVTKETGFLEFECLDRTFHFLSVCEAVVCIILRGSFPSNRSLQIDTRL